MNNPNDICFVYDKFTQAVIDMSLGQEKRFHVGHSEEKYWDAVFISCSSFFGFSIYLGAVLAGEIKVAEELFRLGKPFAGLFQMSDDLGDAMLGENTTDWREDQANLVILYGLIADYPEKKRFLELYPKVHSDPSALIEARDILFRCGAVSNAFYSMVKFYDEGVKIVKDISPPNPEPLLNYLDAFMPGLRKMLADGGYILKPGENLDVGGLR